MHTDAYDDDYDGGDFGEDDGGRPPRLWIPIVALITVIVLAGIFLGLWLTRGSATNASSDPEGVPIENAPNLASAASTLSGAPVDGITCRTSSQQVVKEHLHVHVVIFVHGKEERIPAGVGIAAPRLDEHLSDGLFVDNSFKGCLYWLHVHANDGIIHVESPYVRVFTLGQFFDIWHQALGPDRVGPATGKVVAYENGKRFGGNPSDIPLSAQAVIQIDVGQPVVPFQPVQFNVKGLCGAGTRGCAASVG